MNFAGSHKNEYSAKLRKLLKMKNEPERRKKVSFNELTKPIEKPSCSGSYSTNFEESPVNLIKTRKPTPYYPHVKRLKTNSQIPKQLWKLDSDDSDDAENIKTNGSVSLKRKKKSGVAADEWQQVKVEKPIKLETKEHNDNLDDKNIVFDQESIKSIFEQIQDTECSSSDELEEFHSIVEKVTNEVIENSSKNSPKTVIESPKLSPEIIQESSKIIEKTVQVLPKIDSPKKIIKKKIKKLKVPNYKQFDIINATAIVLENNCVLHIHGLAIVKVLQGTIEILGYTLDKNNKEINLFSPRGTSYLSIKSTGICNNNEINFDLIPGQPDDFYKQLGIESKNKTVVLFKKLTPSYFDFIEKHIAQVIVPKIETGSGCVFKENNRMWNVIKTHEMWDEIVNRTTNTSKLFICGGKGTGKSTLVRYLINKLLIKYNEVCLIDLDPGQPEFTIPGCISTIIIKQPIFGPNYTHIIKPDRSVFVSNVDITHEPDIYMLSIKELLNSSKDLKDTLTIVNYMGYHRSLGLDLVKSVINLIEPTVVVQLNSINPQRNFRQFLNVEYVTRKPTVFTTFLNKLNYDLVIVPSMTDGNKGWELEPRQVREMCILPYFSQKLPNGVLSLTNPKVPLYIKNLDLLKLRFDSREAALEEINASLVALCSLKNIYDGVEIYDCHGWGVVRAINKETRQLALITPESESVLKNVDYLVKGSVNLPPSVYMTAEDVQGQVPYVAVGEMSFTSVTPKRSFLSNKK